MGKVSRRVRWRNGGGWTQVLAQASRGEPVEWRISVAEIERDGLFSDYSGYDRTIVAEDAGFTLEFADGERVELQPLEPYAFAGERAVFCRLHGASASAFNVMTLRSAFCHDVRIVDGEIEVRLVDVLADAPPIEQEFETFDDWERARREFATWEALVKLRFAQDVHDERAQAALATLARCMPQAQCRDAMMMRRFLEPQSRDALEPRVGAHAFTRWRQSVLAFDPAIEPDVARETELYREYTEAAAGAVYHFHGKTHTAASMSAFARCEQREVRRNAAVCVWELYGERAAANDAIFDRLVRCRTAMAYSLGYDSYTDLAFARLGRSDYTRADVSTFRARIAAYVVPLCERITRRQAADLGVDAVMPWDELVFDSKSPLRSDPRRAQSALTNVFARAHPTLGAFAKLMEGRELFDVEARHDKRAGAFCTFFPTLGLPHVFAHFTGTSQDVGSLVHEMGHAFQDYSSRMQPALEYVVPSAETGEVFSLGLEYLLWPFYDDFFGVDADRYRSQHLKTMLLMLPYIAAVDHFQGLVYDNPQAGVEERYHFWLDVSARYLPYRSSGGLAHLERGGAWHRQHHIFGFPFYYIDYALALFAAFDMWRQSSEDHHRTLNRFVSMAQAGGRLPFREFLTAHGIADPFAEGTLKTLVSAIVTSKELV